MDKIIQIKIHSPQGMQVANMPEGTFSIGRSDMADYIIDNTHLSRKHLSVKSHNGQIFISDLGTTNGSFLNERKIVPNQWYEISPIDKIKLGQSEIILQISLVEDNIVDFHAKKTDATRPIQIPKNLGRTSIPQVSSNLAVDFEKTQLLQNEQHLNRQIEDIQARVQDIATPQLSEVQMLQIKKLEIDSKVAAIKIKEDAEKLAKSLVDSATAKAKTIEADSLKKVQDKTAKINELQEKINNLNDRLFKINEEKEQAENEVNLLRNTNDELINEIEVHQKKISDLQDQFSALSEKIEFEQESHNMVIQRKIADAKALEEDKQQIQQEIEACIVQKEEIEALIVQCKEREQAAQENYHKTQARVDKVYQEKDALSEQTDKLKEQIHQFEVKKKELEVELRTYREQMNEEISAFEKQIEQKELRLSVLEDQIQADFKQERTKLQNELTHIKKENELAKTKLLNEREEMAQKIIQKANQSAENIIQEAKNIANELESQTQTMLSEFKKNQEDAHKELDQKRVQIDEHEKAIELELKELRNLTEKEVKELKDLTDKEVKELKDKTHSEIYELQKNAKSEAQTTIDRAIKEYEKTLVKAKDKADQLIDKAKAEAKELFDNSKIEFDKAQTKANELLQSAQDKVIQIHKDGLRELEEQKKNLEVHNKDQEKHRKHLEEAIKTAQNDLDVLVKSLDIERQKLKDEIKDEKEQTLALAQTEAAKIREQAKQEIAIAQKEFEKSQQDQIKKTQIEIENLQKQEEIKFQSKLRDEKNMLSKMRAKELESLKELREKEETALAKAKKEHAMQISKGIETLVSLKLKKIAEASGGRIRVGVEAEEIRKLVHSSLTDQKVQDQAFFKMINPYGALGKEKSTILMKRLAIAGGIALIFIVLHFIFPNLYPTMYQSVASVFKVENSAKDLYLEDVKERRNSRPKFDPKTTPEFKAEGFAANVLYTDNFAKIWLSDKFQTSWSIKVDEIIVYKLQLPDERVVQYIAQEFKTIRSLQNLRDNIKPETQDEQIKQIKLLEEQGLTNLKNILDGDENLKILQIEQKKFFDNFKK